MRSTLRPFLLGLAILGVGAAPADAAETRLTILYNGAVRAEIDDCGCPSRPLGGLARRAHVIEGVQANESHTLLLDAGSIFGDPTRDTFAQSAFVAAETAAMGYEITGVGPYDLGHGVDAIRQVAASSGLEFVNANLKRGGDLLFEPYRIVERGGVRVAVTSVFDPDFAGAEYTTEATDVEIVDPVAAMKTWLPEMDAKADLVVVLSNLKSSNSTVFLRKLHQGGMKQIDLIVDGVFDNAMPKPRQFGPTRIVAANSRGKVLGQIDLTVADGTVTDASNQIHYLDIKLPENEAVAARAEQFEEANGMMTAGSK